MPEVLVVQNAAVESAGLLAGWLDAAGATVATVAAWQEPLPSDPGDALVVLGGPMGAGDDSVAGWLPELRALLADAVDAGVPVLGICLGAQLLAVATGGRVERGAAGPQHGAGRVRLTPAADRDLLLGGTGRREVPVVHWHGDAVTRLPPAATLLADDESYVQAFRVGERAWGLQFHVEVTPALLRAWAAADGLEAAELLPGVEALDLDAAWSGLGRRFAALA